jgi:hypothetical protein
MTAFQELAAKLKKPIPRILVKRQKKADLDKLDREERTKCHARSQGRCEVIEVIAKPEQSAQIRKRCKGKAIHNHHLIGGVGRRNVGISILAEHRIDCCRDCHTDIEVEILRPEKADDCFDAATVAYVRRKEW